MSERERFEAAALNVGMFIDFKPHDEYDDVYFYEETNTAYKLWQAALADRPEQQVAHTAWMIECITAPKPIWFDGSFAQLPDTHRCLYGAQFTDDVNNAVHFSTDKAAHAALASMIAAFPTIGLLGPDNYAITEHVWPPSHPTPSEAGAERQEKWAPFAKEWDDADAALLNDKDCPSCKGSGTVQATVGRGVRRWTGNIYCDKCGGTGAAQPAKGDAS